MAGSWWRWAQTQPVCPRETREPYPSSVSQMYPGILCYSVWALAKKLPRQCLKRAVKLPRLERWVELWKELQECPEDPPPPTASRGNLALVMWTEPVGDGAGTELAYSKCSVTCPYILQFLHLPTDERYALVSSELTSDYFSPLLPWGDLFYIVRNTQQVGASYGQTTLLCRSMLTWVILAPGKGGGSFIWSYWTHKNVLQQLLPRQRQHVAWLCFRLTNMGWRRDPCWRL